MAKKEKVTKRPRGIDSGIGDILGCAHLLRLALECNNFRDWVTRRHFETVLLVFDGYVFALSTLVRLLHQAIDFNSSLQLSEDFVLTRARHQGISIVEVPNSSEKGILLRNLFEDSRPFLAAKSWTQLESRAKIFTDKFLTPLCRLEGHTSVAQPEATPTVDMAISFVAQWHIHLFLNDTRRGLPHGYFQPMLPDKLRPERLNKVFEGYKLTIQYLWFRLGAGAFDGSVAAELHKATNWQEFDSFYRTIQGEFIDPKEEITGLYGGFNSLLILGAKAKAILAPILEPRMTEQQLTPQKELERKFFWYDIELIDSSTAVFNGVLAFVTTLGGTVDFRKRHSNPDKTQVMRIKHPTGTHGKNDYSYGVLLEAFSLMADYSGWLLFFDCCGDYPGFAGGQHQIAEETIQDFQKQDKINVQQIEMGRAEFLKRANKYLLSSKLKRPSSLTTQRPARVSLKDTETFKRLKEKYAAAAGILHELLSYYIMRPSASKGSTHLCEWSYHRNNKDIDAIVRDAHGITFIECKLSQVDPQKDGQDLLNDAQDLLSDQNFRKEWLVDNNTERHYMFITWEQQPEHVSVALRDKGIRLIVAANHSALSRKDKARLKVALNHLE